MTAPVGSDVPTGVVTVTGTVLPFRPPGDVAVISVSLTTLNRGEAFRPNVTEVAPVRSEPLIVTVLPPAAGPEAGPKLEVVGREASFSVKAWVASGAVPFDAVIVIG